MQMVSFHVIFFVAIFAAGYYVYMRKTLAARRDRADAFLSEHPDAARVFLQVGMKGLSSDAITVISVDDNAPVFFSEGRKQGVLLAPGRHILEVAYAWTRPGILHKNVTTQVEPSRQEVEAEARKTYKLDFNREEEEYVFEEIA